MRASPFGLSECCICDGPAVVVIPTERDELLPYCEPCAQDVKRAFPESRVYLEVRFDVTLLTGAELDGLIGEVVVQGEGSENHPGVPVFVAHASPFEPLPASEPESGVQPAGNGSEPLSASRLESGRWLASCSRCTYRVERSKRDAAEHALSVHLAYSHEEVST